MSEIKSKVLALKYRPQTFDHLIGQDIMVETITNSIKIKKIPNAFCLQVLEVLEKLRPQEL